MNTSLQPRHRQRALPPVLALPCPPEEKTFGLRLGLARTARKVRLSVADLARLSGVPTVTIWRYEQRGKIPQNLETVRKLGQALGVAPAWLLLGGGYYAPLGLVLDRYGWRAPRAAGQPYHRTMRALSYRVAACVLNDALRRGLRVCRGARDNLELTHEVERISAELIARSGLATAAPKSRGCRWM